MEGVHLYFEIQLDEERILADGHEVKWMYDFMDEAFAENDCYLEKVEGNMRVYARDKDNKDMGCLFMGVNEIQYENWFEQYVCHFKFYITKIPSRQTAKPTSVIYRLYSANTPPHRRRSPP